MATIYEWTWIGDMHVGVSPERVRIETRRGFTEYVPDRPTCHDTEERVNSFTCSSCGFREGKIVFNPFTYSFRELKPDWNYCPNCGFKVNKEGE